MTKPDYEAALRVGLLAKLDEQFLFRALHNHLPAWARARRRVRAQRADRHRSKHAAAVVAALLAKKEKF